MSNIAMQWYDKLFFCGLGLIVVGGVCCLVAIWSVLQAIRPWD